MRRPWAEAALALLVLAPAPAFAFVRTQTAGAAPKALFWKQSCAPITIYIGNFAGKADLTTSDIAKSIAAAAHAWSPDTVACDDGTHPFFEIVPTLAPSGAALPAIADDARNVLVFRTDNWTLDGTITGEALVAEALAYTQVTKHGDGHISDVDILVNGTAATWQWRNFDPGVPAAPPDHGAPIKEYDLQAALTHEFGHFLGLSHTCFQPGEAATWPTNDQGDEIPDCDLSPEAVIRTVMYFRTAANDVSKRVLSADDARGICAIYPPRLDPKSCTVDVGLDGCVVAPVRSRRGWGVGVVAALAAGIIAAWRRRRARA